ncbi:MAG: nicotinate-nucleotide adenylyltransferase [Bellilinea sp.]
MRIGIFGGTFDPPHIGHLILTAEALEQLKLDKVLWTLTADPPHKQGRTISPVDIRLQLLQAALADNPAFEISRVEIDRPSPHFAVDTVRILQGQYAQATLIYLIGSDSLRDLTSWHTPQDLTARVGGYGVMRRPGVDIDLTALERDIPGITAKVQFMDTPLVEISARQIRQRAAAGQTYRYFLPPQVFELVEEFNLYRPVGIQKEGK